MGEVSTIGRNGTAELLQIIADVADDRIPPVARFCLDLLARQYLTLIAEVSAIDKRIHAWHRSCEESRRLEEIPGIGPIVATTLVAEIGNWRCSYVRKFLPRRRPHVTQSGHALPVAACGAEAAT